EAYGFARIVEALDLFAEGLETPAVVERITGKPVAAFDAEFRAYLERRLAAYRGTFHLPSAGLGAVKRLAAAAARAPRDAGARGRLALGRFYDGDARGAEADARAALRLDPRQPLALYVAAELATRRGDLARARDHYERLIRAGGDSFDARVRL